MKKINKHHNGKLFLKKGDKVKVITGNDKGTVGEVKEVYKDTYRVLVDGVNMISRHTKPNQANPNGGIIKKEAPVHISNVMLVDPKGGAATRIRREKKGEKRIRVAVKSGEEIK